jgi:hypothetical protein
MTPEAQTTYSILLFGTLVILQQWLNRRHRMQMSVREQVAVSAERAEGPAALHLVPAMRKSEAKAANEAGLAISAFS